MDTKTVVHFMRTFGEPSQIWLIDLIHATASYKSIVLCERLGDGPLPADVAVEPTLPSPPSPPSPPTGAPTPKRRRWRREYVHNPWRSAIDGIVPADVLAHAHFGPVGWRCVDAGLSRVITTFYGYDMSRLPRQKRWRRAYRTLFSRGAAFLAEGPTMRKALIGLGAPPARTHIQPLVADLTVSIPTPVSERDAIILMAGRFVEKKGFVDGVRAFAAVANVHAAARLVIIGSGPEEDNIAGAIRESGVAPRIEVRPFLDRESYRAALAEAAIVLQPSRMAHDGDSEGGAPTSLLDAQVLGTLVVASRHADIPFVVDQAAAYLADEGDLGSLTDVLDHALATRDEWDERASQGRRHVERQHSAAAVGTALEAVYDDISRT